MRPVSLLLALVLCPAPGLRADDAIPPKTLADLKAATVFVQVTATRGAATGTGFVIRLDGDTALVVTNEHVVNPPPAAGRRVRVAAVLHSGRGAAEKSVPAEVLAADTLRDLAVLRVTGVKGLAKAIDLDQRVELSETMTVYALGFPFGTALSTTRGNPAITIGKGTVSSIREDDRGDVAVVQIDGDVNPGNSGGPVVDARGRLVGVAVARIANTRIGLAIPPLELTRMLNGRLSGLVTQVAKVADGVAEVDIELHFIDPLGKVAKAAVRVLPKRSAGEPDPAGGERDRRPLPGADVFPLTVAADKQRATARVVLKGPATGAAEFWVQPVYTNGERADVLAGSSPLRIEFSPAVKATPAPRPATPPPPGSRRDAAPPAEHQRPAAPTPRPPARPTPDAAPSGGEGDPGGPSMFAVNTNPERFEGKTVVFGRAHVFGGVVRRGDLYELQASNENRAKPDDLTFRVSKAVAGKVTELGLGPQYHPARLTCTIERDGKRWLARTTKIEFTDGGKVTRTVAEEDAADLLAVNADPARYEGQTLVFDRVNVFGRPARVGDADELRVSNEAKARPDDLPFVLTPELAKAFEGLKLADRRYRGRVTCWVERVGAGWRARVTRVEVEDEGGTRVVK